MVYATGVGNTGRSTLLTEMIDSSQRNTNSRAPRRGPQHSRPGAAAARRRRAAQHQQDVHHSSAAAAAAAVAPASPTRGATSHTEATPSSAIQCRPSSYNNSPNASTQQESSDGDSNTNDSNERGRPNDTQAWFDRSNENPSTTLDNSAMDGKLIPELQSPFCARVLV